MNFYVDLFRVIRSNYGFTFGLIDITTSSTTNEDEISIRKKSFIIYALYSIYQTQHLSPSEKIRITAGRFLYLMFALVILIL